MLVPSMRTTISAARAATRTTALPAASASNTPAQGPMVGFYFSVHSVRPHSPTEILCDAPDYRPVVLAPGSLLPAAGGARPCVCGGVDPHFGRGLAGAPAARPSYRLRTRKTSRDASELANRRRSPGDLGPSAMLVRWPTLTADTSTRSAPNPQTAVFMLSVRIAHTPGRRPSPRVNPTSGEGQRTQQAIPDRGDRYDRSVAAAAATQASRPLHDSRHQADVAAGHLDHGARR